MKGKHSFSMEICHLVIPVALQSMLHTSFSIVDQVMIGQLGSVQVAGVGMAGKFASVFSVLVSSVGAVLLSVLVVLSSFAYAGIWKDDRRGEETF